MNTDKINTILAESNLPATILQHIGIDADGSVAIDLDAIEQILGASGTSYGEVAVYQQIGEAMRTAQTKTFSFGQFWTVYGQNSVEVPADFTIEEAIQYVKKHRNEIGLADSPEYVDDTDRLDFECCEFEDGEEGLW